MIKTAGRIVLAALALCMVAGCGGGSAPGMESRTSRINAGEKAMLHNDDGEFVYIGEGQWGVPVGTMVVVVEDSGDDKDQMRKVRIKADASTVANGAKKPHAGEIETTIERRNLRPGTN